MRILHAFLVILVGGPLVGQAWDVRMEVPFAQGQGLPGAFIQGMGMLSDGGLDRGSGKIFSVNRRLLRVNPVLRLDWTLEYAQWKADGDVQIGTTTYGTHLRQTGVGVGLNAQFWIPFTGVAGEVGMIQRFQGYEFRAAGERQNEHTSRTWLRIGARWRLPLPVVAPYLAVSYQRPVTKDHPASVDSVLDLSSYLNTQGSGQEADRIWTVGVGVQF